MTPEKFQQTFNLRALDDHMLGCVEFVLNSPAYADVFAPYLKGVRDSMNRMLLDRSASRKDEYPDDFLAGGIVAIDGLLFFFDLLLHETDMERIHAAMAEMTPDIQYTLQQRRGGVKPVLGIDQQATPGEYNPNEDF